ncbi:MAG: DsbA family oxidoreductase [Gammaproteobacteria bacterium]|nr:DsbA family oxidoreductase [Gammaproteobacteria bacterium]
MSQAISIQIVSDIVCPWCYIGKRRLEKALAQRPGLATEISWFPYQLSPDMPREGKDRVEHHASIFGAERAGQIREKMHELGIAEGIPFDTPPGARSPNTLSAHVLMYWASRSAGIDQNLLAEKLFHAHHVRGEDVGSPIVLVGIASEVGMNAAEVLAALRDGTDEDTVRDLIEQARQAGVSGVPLFIFDGRHALSGAQPPETILEVLDQLASERGARASA